MGPWHRALKGRSEMRRMTIIQEKKRWKRSSSRRDRRDRRDRRRKSLP